MHGQTSEVTHDSSTLFENVPNPFAACRYHSLVAERDSLPNGLRATAWTSDQTVMAIAHETLPVVGVQFHPEAILTRCGYQLMANFLKLAGLMVDANPTDLAQSELREPIKNLPPLPDQPVTF